ncbi:MAG: TIGR02594 family protein [Hyphomicrobium sp.]
MRWLEAAWHEQGVREIEGPRSNDRVRGYFREVGRADVTSDEVAWCAAFAGAMLEEGGIDIDAIAPANRLLANSYLKIGTPISAPRMGALCVLARGKDPAQGHVGFVVGWTDDTIKLLGGNQNDQVSVETFRRDRIRGLRWPEAVTAKDLDSAGSRITTAAKRNQRDAGWAVVIETSKQMVEAAPAPAGGDIAGIEQAAAAFGAYCAAKWPYVALVWQAYLVIGMLYRSGLIRGWRAEDASTGKTATAGGAA